MPANPHVYLLYVDENDAADYTGTKTSRLTRVTVVGDTASPASEVVVLGTAVGRTCKSFPAGADCLPGGRPVALGQEREVRLRRHPSSPSADASSFYTVDPDALRAQDLDSLAGKLMHVTRTGQGVPANPFYTGDAGAARSKVWAYGVRNAYRFGVRPGSNVPYLGDVGWDTWEEINVAHAGANFGWPCYEGAAQQPGYSSYPTCVALLPGVRDAGIAGDPGDPHRPRDDPLGSGAPLSAIKNQVKPPVGSGDPTTQYDSWDGNNFAPDDWVGYTFTAPHTFDRVVFQEGMHFGDGGWFNTLTVQVRQNGTWVNVSGLAISPPYPGNNGISFESFTMTFTPIQGDGIRIYGAPGGSAAFVSVGELEVYGQDSGGGGSGGGGQPAGTVITAQATSTFARVPASLGLGVGRRHPRRVTSRRSAAVTPAASTTAGTATTRPPTTGSGTRSARPRPSRASPSRRDRVLGRRVVQHADGSGSAERAVGQRVGARQHSAVSASNNGVSFGTFALTFTPIQGDAIRLYGAPGGVSGLHLGRGARSSRRHRPRGSAAGPALRGSRRRS